MEIKDRCKECGKESTRVIKVGDVLVATDPSGMPRGLAKLLAMGGKDPGIRQEFSPIVVACINGEFLGVIPLAWKACGRTRYSSYKDLTPPAEDALSWLGDDTDEQIVKAYGRYGYWVWAWASHYKLYKEV